MFICIMPIFHQITGACEFKIALIKNNCEIINKLILHIKFQRNNENEKLCVTIFCFVSAGSGFEVYNIKSHTIPTRLKNQYDRIITLPTHQISKTERSQLINYDICFYYQILGETTFKTHCPIATIQENRNHLIPSFISNLSFSRTN